MQKILSETSQVLNSYRFLLELKQSIFHSDYRIICRSTCVLKPPLHHIVQLRSSTIFEVCLVLHTCHLIRNMGRIELDYNITMWGGKYNCPMYHPPPLPPKPMGASERGYKCHYQRKNVREGYSSIGGSNPEVVWCQGISEFTRSEERREFTYRK